MNTFRTQKQTKPLYNNLTVIQNFQLGIACSQFLKPQGEKKSKIYNLHKARPSYYNKDTIQIPKETVSIHKKITKFLQNPSNLHHGDSNPRISIS